MRRDVAVAILFRKDVFQMNQVLEQCYRQCYGESKRKLINNFLATREPL